MKNLYIRLAQASELPVIQAIAQNVIKARYPVFMGDDAVDAFVDSGQSDEEFVTHQDNLYVLLKGNEIVGFSICFDDFIHLMMVKLDVQSKGLGSFLLNECEAMIKRGLHAVARLETFVANKQAVGFYLKNGWSEVKRDDADAGPFARIWFEKPTA